MAQGDTRISTKEFVVHLKPQSKQDEVRKRIEKLGSWSEIPGHADTYVVHVDAAFKSAREGWKTLCKAAGSAGEVLPVFVTAEGEPQYSVGTVHLRFPAPPSDEELKDLLPASVRVIERNEYVPAQIAVEPTNLRKQFLPDVLSELQQQSGAEVQVWPETLQAFRRA